jgi:spoIIIJ-associated protein
VSSNVDDVAPNGGTGARPPRDPAIDEPKSADGRIEDEASEARSTLPPTEEVAEGESEAPPGPRAVAAEAGPFVEDGRADMALDFVVDVLGKMGMDCTVDLMENDETDPPSDIRIEISGRDAERLIGKKGQTLAAAQYLVSRVVNRPGRSRRHVILDAAGYRARREGSLSAMAQRLGKQAVEEGKIITFEPMSAQDRRVVHLALAKYPGVVTRSEGKGAARRVQIIPVRENEPPPPEE